MPTYELESRATINFIDAGPRGGTVVVLLHGMGATGDSWRPQIQALGDAGYRVIAPDGRGFGASSYPGGGNSPALLAGDTAAMLAALGAERAHVVGISMGGTVALQLALDHPRLVDRLVLVNTFASLRPKSPGIWLYFLLRLLLVHTLGLPTQARTVAQRIFPHPDQEELRQELMAQICRADPRGYRAMMRGLARFDVVDRLGEVAAPTLVVTSADDTTVPRASQQVLANGIPGCRHEIVPGAGHAVISDHPEDFNRLLLDFLGEATDPN